MSDHQKYKFLHPLRVRYNETDAQGRVFFGNYLNYFDVALTEYMRAIDFTYQDMHDTGMDMFYVEADCQYKGAARFDDLLHVHALVSHIGNTSFTFNFTIFKMPDDELIATGHITAVAADLQSEKPMRVPDELRKAVARYEENPNNE